MPFIYIYSPSDFVGGLPDEVGAQAEGAGPWSLTLVAGATPTLIEISDNDLIFDEVDTTQALTNAVTVDGTAYAAGTTIHSAYDLINSDTDHKVTSFHFGGDGYQQGAVAGIASTTPLTAGVTYTFDTERTSVNQTNPYSDFTACFVAGTRIHTRNGLVRVEDLEVGDEIETQDGEFQPLRLKLNRVVSSDELIERPKLRPIRIEAGALGNQLPVRDLLVSPQHRMHVSSPIVKRMFGTESVLVAATKLTALPGIYVEDAKSEVVYFHLVMDNHEIVFAEGAPTESFYFGDFAIKAMTGEARGELLALFPTALMAGFIPTSARYIPEGRKQRKLVERHRKNNTALMI